MLLECYLKKITIIMKPRQWNSYRPEDVKRWGVERFLQKTAPKDPVPIPDLDFTEEENNRMDELLREEKEYNAQPH